jgi:single-strand DNA-binding protein
MDTYLTVTGNLTADPTQRLTAAGATVVHMRIASSGRKFDKATGEFRDGDPLFINVSCWRGLAANVFATLRKGDSVIVHGRLLYRTYDDKHGARHNVHEIDAIAVGPDLSRYPAELRRPVRQAEPATQPETTTNGAPAADPSPADAVAA